MQVEIQVMAVHETDFIARSKHAVCEIDMQYGVKILSKATFNAPASITCQTTGTTLDTQNVYPAWKAKVWHSVRVASRGHFLSVWRQCPVQVSSAHWEVRTQAGKVGSLPSFDPDDTSLPWSITIVTLALPFPQSRTHTYVNREGEFDLSFHLLSCALFAQVQVRSVALAIQCNNSNQQRHSNIGMLFIQVILNAGACLLLDH